MYSSIIIGKPSSWDNDLPGSPNIGLPRHATVVFVHGCFWHLHSGCKGATTPKSRRRFWCEKFERNVERDAQNLRDLRRLGWRPLIVWECELRKPDKLHRRLARLFQKSS